MNRRWAGPLSIAALAVLAAAALLISRRSPHVPSRVSSARASETSSVEVPPEPPAPRSAAPAAAPARTPAATAFDRLLAALKSGDKAKIKEALDVLHKELIPPPVSDAENAALLYSKAFEKYVEDLNQEDCELLSKLSEQGFVTPEERAKLQRLLDRNREALDLLHKAAALPKCNFNLDYSKGFNLEMPHINGLIRGAKLLNVEALLAGKDGASRSTLASMRLAEATANEPILISQLVRNICHGIGSEARQLEFGGNVGRDHLLTLIEQFAPEKIRESSEKTLLFELYSGVKFVTEGGDAGLLGLQGTVRRPDDPMTPYDLAHYAETLQEYSSLAGRPYYEIREGLERIQAAKVNGAPWYADITRMVCPNFEKAIRQQAVAEATLGTAQVAAALRLYREEIGVYPATLDALEGILPGVPLDPFTGKPYVYRLEGNGFVVYSVGADGADGGGAGGTDGQADLVFRSPR